MLCKKKKSSICLSDQAMKFRTRNFQLTLPFQKRKMIVEDKNHFYSFVHFFNKSLVFIVLNSIIWCDT